VHVAVLTVLHDQHKVVLLHAYAHQLANITVPQFPVTPAERGECLHACVECDR
jgi:hypothetical protein